MNMHAVGVNRWYHEPWPWLLMAGPAAVVLAGAVTIYLALVSNDGLVADDYYKQGLAINQTLSRDAVAREHGHRARIAFAADFNRVEVTFVGGVVVSGPLLLRVAHPGRPAFDRALPLTRDGDNVYVSAFPPLTPGRWRVTLEDAGRTWRLSGDILVPGRAAIDVGPR